jgi:hypothetical protein
MYCKDNRSFINDIYAKIAVVIRITPGETARMIRITPDWFLAIKSDGGRFHYCEYFIINVLLNHRNIFRSHSRHFGLSNGILSNFSRMDRKWVIRWGKILNVFLLEWSELPHPDCLDDPSYPMRGNSNHLNIAFSIFHNSFLQYMIFWRFFRHLIEKTSIYFSYKNFVYTMYNRGERRKTRWIFQNLIRISPLDCISVHMMKKAHVIYTTQIELKTHDFYSEV